VYVRSRSLSFCRKQLWAGVASGAYLAAGLEVLALGVDALVVVDVVLPAVLGLVLVREAGVEAWWASGLAGRVPDMANACLSSIYGLRGRGWCMRTSCEGVSISAFKVSLQRARGTHQSRT
jgi:hypothetical protein